MNNYTGCFLLACSILISTSHAMDPLAEQVNQSISPDDQGIVRITAHTKHTLPAVAQTTACNTYCGFLKNNSSVNHPSAATLFANDAALSNLLSEFITAITQKPDFLPFFSKIHLLILHQLYLYLTGIYATFSVSHAQTIKEHYFFEQRYALSIKTLIVFHLINLIESQLNQAIRARMHGMPQNMASYSGIVALKQDYSCNLGVLISTTEQQIQQELNDSSGKIIDKERQSYLTLYGNYLSFFHKYCMCIDQQDTDGFSVFNRHALRIRNVINQAAGLKELKTINPAVFFYEPVTMTSLQMVPLLSKLLPSDTQSLPWPSIVVRHAEHQTQARSNFNATLLSDNTIATEGIPLGYEIAFFKKDIQDNTRLYLNIPITGSKTHTTLYAQELTAQPNWLNNATGIMRMLKACLGDFSLLVSDPLNQEPIIDPFLACITHNAAQSVRLAVPMSNACSFCSAFFKGINQSDTSQQQSLEPSFSPQLPQS